MTNPQEFLEISTPLRRRVVRVVEEIKADEKMGELLRVKKLLNAVEEEYAMPQTTLAELFKLEDAGVAVKPGEFYGLSPLEAAKRYLSKRGEARPLAEIASAIKEGGAKLTDEGELRLSLSRSTMEVAKVGPDFYGLVEFYPHVKRGRKRRLAAEAGEYHIHGADGKILESVTVERDDPDELEDESDSLDETAETRS